MKGIKLIIFLFGVAYLSYQLPKILSPIKTRTIPRILSTPGGESAKYPNVDFSQTNRFLWWQENEKIKFSLLSGSGWSDPSTISENSGNNWAEPSDVTFYNNKYYAIVKTMSQKLILVNSNDGIKWDNANISIPQSGMGEVGFGKFLKTQDQLYIVWLEGNTEQNSQLVLFNPQSQKKTVIDDRVCECCSVGIQHGLDNSPAYIAYRDRRDNNERPIQVAAVVSDTSFELASFNQVEWIIDGCPINGPKILATKDFVAISWFVGNERNGENYLAIGKSFQTIEKVGRFGEELPSMGKIAMVDLDADNFLISWIGKNEQDAGRLFAIRYNIPENTWSPIFELGGIDSSQASGFPVLDSHEDKVILAWTSLSRKMLMIREFQNEFFFNEGGRDPKKPDISPATSSTSSILLEQINLKTPDNKDIQLFKEKNNIIVFWATWCEPCLEEIPLFNELFAKYPEFNIVSVVLDPSEDLTSKIQSLNIKYPVYYDPTGDIESQFDVGSIPLTILVDKNFSEIWRIVGNDKDNLIAKIGLISKNSL